MAWRKSDTLSVVAIVVSAVAAYYSFHVAKETRLDAKRQYVRSEAVSIINSYQSNLELADCYFSLLGKPPSSNDRGLIDLQSGLDKAKHNLALLPNWSDDQLDAYQATITDIPTKIGMRTTTLLQHIRSQFPDSQLTHVNDVCHTRG